MTSSNNFLSNEYLEQRKAVTFTDDQLLSIVTGKSNVSLWPSQQLFLRYFEYYSQELAKDSNSREYITNLVTSFNDRFIESVFHDRQSGKSTAITIAILKTLFTRPDMPIVFLSPTRHIGVDFHSRLLSAAQKIIASSVRNVFNESEKSIIDYNFSIQNLVEQKLTSLVIDDKDIWYEEFASSYPRKTIVLKDFPKQTLYRNVWELPYNGLITLQITRQPKKVEYLYGLDLGLSHE